MTIFAFKFQPKNTKSTAVLVQNLDKIQTFFHKSLQLDKFEGVHFKYDNIVFKLHSKNTETRDIWCKIQAFLFLLQILQLDKFEGVYFKYDNIYFQILAQKYQNTAVLVQNLDKIQTLFHKSLQLDKFEGVHFKYDSIIFNSQPNETQISHFGSQI